MKEFNITLFEYNNSNLTEEKLKRILNDALKSYGAGEVKKVTQIKN